MFMAVVISQWNVDNCFVYTLKRKYSDMCAQYVILHSIIVEVLVFSEGIAGK
jgi:hypothetical protein